MYEGFMTDFLLIPWMFIVLPIINSSQSACPESCTCATARGLVNCQWAGLRHIPWDLPAPMELTHLDLSNNDISEVNAQVMYPNLRYLDLSSNTIVAVLGDNLRDLPHLEVLYLKANRLSSLEDNAFVGMSQLRSLDVSDNQLVHIQSGLFRDLHGLEELNLASNSLESFGEGAFQGLNSLHHINLADNQLAGLRALTFSQLQSLKTLNLGYNRIRNLTSGAFSQIPLLREIDLEANRITVISENAFAERGSSRVSYIEEVNLRNNLLMKVPSGIPLLENLKTLDLSQNPISIIPAGAFQGLARLRAIYLNTMSELKTVHSDAFIGLSNLQDFEMHSNLKLEVIEDDAFRDVPLLKKVDLHANSLRTLDGALLDWEGIHLLDLRYNPWHCDCHMSWLPHVLQSQATNLTQYITQEVRCHSPESLATKLVVAVQDQLRTTECRDDSLVTVAMKPEKFQDHILIAIMCSVGGILVVIIVILMCKYGKSYSTAYAPAMDQYVCRSTDKVDDIENQRVPVIEGDMSAARELRSSLSSGTGIGVPRHQRRLHRVRFVDASADVS